MQVGDILKVRGSNVNVEIKRIAGKKALVYILKNNERISLRDGFKMKIVQLDSLCQV